MTWTDNQQGCRGVPYSKVKNHATKHSTNQCGTGSTAAHSKGHNLQHDGLQLTGNEWSTAKPLKERLSLTVQTHWQQPALSQLSLKSKKKQLNSAPHSQLWSRGCVCKCTGCDPLGHLKNSPALIHICTTISIFTWLVFL